MREKKPVSYSVVETVHLMHPEYLNHFGRLYGGKLMAWIDDIAILVARRHTGMPVVTGSVDNLRFLHGATINDVIILRGKATCVGNTSMEVKVETFVEHIDGNRELVNRAFLTIVGLDEKGVPSQIPDLILETEEDKEEWEKANKRREIRKKQNLDGFHFYG